MQAVNEYIGDDKFKKFLEHYACPVSLDVVKMRIAGAICSPNLALRPTDVFSSLWEQNLQPRLETKNEAELFFKFFMGLWDQIFNRILQNKFSLPEIEKSDPYLWAVSRYEEIELGYLEGFWGGKHDLSVPAFVARLLDSLSETADVYTKLARKIAENNPDDDLKPILKNMDKTVEKAIRFILENAVLPNMNKITNKPH